MSHIPYYGQPEKAPRMKNGFELRAELIALAKSYVENQYQANLEYCSKMSKLTSTETLEALAKPYTFDDVLKYAKEMYSFVSNKE